MGNNTISAHQAMIYTMVTMAGVDGRIGEEELMHIGRLTKTLPVFNDFDPERLIHVSKECGDILQVEDGLQTVLTLISNCLTEPRLRETAYALAVEVAVIDLMVAREEIRFLALLRDALNLDKLVTAAIERGARARYQDL